MKAIHFAAQAGNLKLVKQMAVRGLRLDLPNADKWTPLHFAVQGGHIDLIRFLISQDVSVNHITAQGLSPLHFAGQTGDEYIVTLLIESGASLDAKDSSGQTPLHYAITSQCLNCVKFLLNFAADPNIMDRDGFAPLHIAASEGNYIMAEALLDGKAIPDLIHPPTKREVYWSPLHYAARRGADDILGLLLDKGANPSVQNSLQVTPLHIAASEKQRRAVDLLIQRGASPGLPDSDGETPLFGAIRGHSIEIVQLLSTPETIAIASKSGQTALHLASKLGFADIVKFLLDRKADPTPGDSDGNTPLHLAVIHKRKQIVRLLLDAGCDILRRNNEHKSPFALATGALIQIMKLHMDQNPKAVRPVAVQQVKCSTKSVPSRLKLQLGQKKTVKNVSKRPEDVSAETVEDIRPESLEAFDKLIRDEINELRDSLTTQVASVRQLLDDLRSDFRSINNE
jgi:ankyrin repeat protein